MGKKSRENKATVAESLIQFQIDVKSKEIEEFKKEISELEAKNHQLVELREQLLGEQQENLSVLHSQAKEQEKKLEEKEVTYKGEVKQAVQHNLELTHVQEEELAELQRHLESIQAQVVELKGQGQAWHLNKNVGSVPYQEQIQKLQSELDSMHKHFQIMSENVENSLQATICNIEKQILQLIEEEKQAAQERSIKKLDKPKLLELKKNEWLKQKLAIYHEEVSVLDAAVKNLEEENLDHMKQLLEHRFNDLQISSNLVLTQAEELEQKLSIFGKGAEIGSKQHQQSGELEEDETNHSCKSSSSTRHRSALLYGCQSDLREPLHLGPLEQNLLSVVGQAMPLHPLPSDPEDSDTLTHQARFQTQDGTLTTNILRKKFQ
ncbi:coiled-coil domain-containing protein 83 [Clarias gariepinus]|uniref:coiled-coil domain-containing protein 83 n=1 Tax=Clarias gariepinus TaxID=13013 RepID=UPI00234C2DF8|nr:coiled-coil domain-containing protein 83 [Clarias gariepinus]